MITRLRVIDCADALKSYYSRDSETFEVELPGTCRDTETSATPDPSGPSYMSFLNTVSVSDSPGVHGARPSDYTRVRTGDLRSPGGGGTAGCASALTFRFEETLRVRRLATRIWPPWLGAAGHDVGKRCGD
jgi:hypothetical protein